MTKELRQTDASYLRTLSELRRRAQAGVKLTYFDDNTPGNKTMGCSLGLCDDKITRMQDGLYRLETHYCPHDSRYFTVEGNIQAEKGQGLSGCFYTCRIFNGSNVDRRKAAQRILIATESKP